MYVADICIVILLTDVALALGSLFRKPEHLFRSLKRLLKAVDIVARHAERELG